MRNMNKFNEIYRTLIRKAVHCEPNLEDLNHKTYMSDVICESVFPKPWRLIADIKHHFDERHKKTTYENKDLVRLIDKDWKFYDELMKLPDNITLTVLICRRNEIDENIGFNAGEVIGLMSELNNVQNKDDWIHEFIWIDSTKEFDAALFDDILQHELGHVWTFLFGNNDSSFIVGQTPRCLCSMKRFNRMQLDVLYAFYKNNAERLSNDVKYVLGNTKEPVSYEFTAITDEIIEVLVEDYLEENSNISTSAYLISLFDSLNDLSTPRYDRLTVVKHYVEQKSYKRIADVSFIMNAVRRMFLIFAFGSIEQKNSFKHACEEEFGKLDK
jgi:hypothetical protein